MVMWKDHFVPYKDKMQIDILLLDNTFVIRNFIFLKMFHFLLSRRKIFFGK